MGTIINTNVAALNSQRSLKVVGGQADKASEKLSSGMRINRAGDDAAGLAISEKMRSQIKGLNQSSRNASDGISLIQTAEGALQESHEMLQRMRELVVQASNDTNVTKDKQKIASELKQLSLEITATANKTEFNKKKLIDGSFSAKDIYLQVGANYASGVSSQSLSFKIDMMTASALGVDNAAVGAIVSTKGGVSVAQLISIVDAAIEKVSTQRAKLGAYQNRLEHTIKNLDVASENLSASESRVRDTDMAKEMMNFTKSNVLTQAAQSMLSQANQAPNNVLQLLR